jgi:hypothetical protein
MFKISYIVDDKKLPEMIRATFDHVTSLKVVPLDHVETAAAPTPVRVVKRKLLPPPQAKKATGAPPKHRNFIEELGWEKGRQFGGEDVAKRCGSLGLDIASRWYVIGNEVKHKRIRKVSLGRYVVL